MIKGEDSTDKEELEKTLDDMEIQLVKITMDLQWIKRIVVTATIIAAGILGVQLPTIFIP